MGAKIAMKSLFRGLLAILLLFSSGIAMAKPSLVPAHVVKITTLSTMLADSGFGEWGYAALIEVDGRRVLFDTGANPDVVMHNALVLGIDLSTVDDVVISHFHADHTGGLTTLRRAMMVKRSLALSRLHVGAGIFEPRFNQEGDQINSFIAIAEGFRMTGGVVLEHAGPSEIVPGVWLTGPVARSHDETNWSGTAFVKVAGKSVVDDLHEDSSIIIPTSEGTIILTGCGHAGIMNIADTAQSMTSGAPLLAVVGGIHLFEKPDKVLKATAARLKGLRYLLAGHCTGIEATIRLRDLLGMDRHHAVVEAVGSTFSLDKGIEAGKIAGWPG